MGFRYNTTLKVRKALELIGMEDEAVDVVRALGTRNLVVIEREKLINAHWLTERIAVLEAAAEFRSQTREKR